MTEDKYKTVSENLINQVIDEVYLFIILKITRLKNSLQLRIWKQRTKG